jgi:hypothetical protein
MKVLFNAYRLDQYTDPEGFKLSIGLVLEQYPIDTIKFVTDPRTGIQRRCTFPPGVKEVVEACDQHIYEVARTKRFQNWGKSNDLMPRAIELLGTSGTHANCPVSQPIEGDKPFPPMPARPAREVRAGEGYH